ncbi:hypothetical protein M3231_27630 [Neobacillus mesonae]|nr:hypothetical protein [Neobacillus mesonae]
MIRIRSILVCLFLIAGCQTDAEPSPEHITLSEVYPGDILDVDHIELIDGSSGNRIMIDDFAEVQSWISRIEDITFTPEDSQEGSVGYIYGLGFYEGEEMKLGFNPHYIDGVYYESNPDFMKHVIDLFEDKFEKDF